MEIETWSIDRVIPFNNNARVHDEKSISAIKASVNRFDWLSPICVDKNGVVICGHGRLAAAKELGMTEVPVLVADWLTDNEVAAAREADNMTQDLSYFDMELLNMNLGEIDWLDIDMSEFGFKLDDELFGEAEEDDYTEDDASAAPSRAQRGDIWQLGTHRLMCGDSTSETDVESLMGGVSADMVFTDPPYNIDTGGGSTGFHGKMQRLMNNIEHLSNFNPEKFLEILYSKIFSHGEMNAYVFCNDALIPEYMLSARQNGCRCSVLVWDKGHAFPISNAHRPDIEYLIFIRKNAIWNSGLKDADYSKVLRYSHEFANEKNGNHPTVKPVELIANELKISSNEFSVVVDMFGGSGSTLIACEQLGRKCYMMELDPHYCDVIIDRWEKLTGEEAVRL